MYIYIYIYMYVYIYITYIYIHLNVYGAQLLTSLFAFPLRLSTTFHADGHSAFRVLLRLHHTADFKGCVWITRK